MMALKRRVFRIELRIDEESGRTVVCEGGTQAEAEHQARACEWLLTVISFAEQFERVKPAAAAYWRCQCGSGIPNRVLTPEDWPGWSGMADLVCAAYQEHLGRFDNWRDWVIEAGWVDEPSSQ